MFRHLIDKHVHTHCAETLACPDASLDFPKLAISTYGSSKSCCEFQIQFQPGIVFLFFFFFLSGETRALVHGCLQTKQTQGKGKANTDAHALPRTLARTNCEIPYYAKSCCSSENRELRKRRWTKQEKGKQKENKKKITVVSVHRARIASFIICAVSELHVQKYDGGKGEREEERRARYVANNVDEGFPPVLTSATFPNVFWNVFIGFTRNKKKS